MNREPHFDENEVLRQCMSPLNEEVPDMPENFHAQWTALVKEDAMKQEETRKVAPMRRYERARKADFAAMGNLTDGLFNLFNQDNKLVQQLRNWGMTGVNQVAPLKSWLTRQAMGHSDTAHR